MKSSPREWIGIVLGMLLSMAAVVTVGITGPAGATLLFSRRTWLLHLRGAWRLLWIPVAAAMIVGIVVWIGFVAAIARNDHHTFTNGSPTLAAVWVVAA